MSSDGAHLGVSANRAIDTILGGADQPTDEERMNPEQMREWLLAAPTAEAFDYALAQDPAHTYTDEDYGECARVTAAAILRAFLSEPSLAAMPTETDYDWQGDPDHGSAGMKPEFVRAYGVDHALRERGVTYPAGISGFQWGWALNAARFCVELPPAPNPAIIDVRSSK